MQMTYSQSKSFVVAGSAFSKLLVLQAVLCSRCANFQTEHSSSLQMSISEAGTTAVPLTDVALKEPVEVGQLWSHVVIRSI